MAKVRIQMAPEIEFKMEIVIEGVDVESRDYDVQQHKWEVHEEFMRRLTAAFPEGFKIYGFEFGLDTGWHEELEGH